jgi:hypothetical protein
VEAMLGLCFVMEAVTGMIKTEGCASASEEDFEIFFRTEDFADWLCHQLRNYTIPLAKDALEALLSPVQAGDPMDVEEEPTRGEEVVPLGRDLFGAPPTADELSSTAATRGGSSYYGNLPGADASRAQRPDGQLVDQVIQRSTYIREKYVRCRQAMAVAVDHIAKLEECTRPLITMLAQMDAVWTAVQAKEVPPVYVAPEEFAVSLHEEDLAQQAADRQHSRSAMTQGLGEVRIPQEVETPSGAAAGAAEAAADAEAPGGLAAPAAEEAVFPFSDIRERYSLVHTRLPPPLFARKVGLTFGALTDMPWAEEPTQESFDIFLKLVKNDADYIGRITELEKIDEELNNTLVIRLMAILRHGSPLTPNPMWHFFAPLGRIVSIVLQHKDFKGSAASAITDETVLCALMTADCFASAPGTPCFQTLSIVKDDVRMMFARADPANTQVTHTINSDGFRVAAAPYKQMGKKGGKGAPYQQPSGKAATAWSPAWRGYADTRGAGASSSSGWWEPPAPEPWSQWTSSPAK